MATPGSHPDAFAQIAANLQRLSNGLGTTLAPQTLVTMPLAERNLNTIVSPANSTNKVLNTFSFMFSAAR